MSQSYQTVYFAGSPLLQPQWCQLAYWEECNRVGRLVPVSSSHIEVFSLLPKSKGRHEGSGLCLATLFKQNKSPSESTAKTREKIGQGKRKEPDHSKTIRPVS